MPEIQAATYIDYSKRRCQSEILKLILCPKSVIDCWDDVANRKVSVAVLGEGRPAVVGVSLVRRCERNKRIGKFTFDVVEIVKRPGRVRAEILAELQIYPELAAVEELVVTRELVRPIRREIQFGIEDRENANRRKWRYANR